VGKQLLVLYLAGDMLLYFVYKALRGDLRYGTNLSSTSSIVFTILMRVCEKIMVDFCAFMQMRHPAQAGGLAFAASLLLSQVSCFACGWLYLNAIVTTEEVGSELDDDWVDSEDGAQEDGASAAAKFSANVVWGTIGSLFAVFLVSSIVFVSICKKDCLASFVSLDTFPTFIRKRFEGIPDGSDEQKAEIFKTHPVHRKRFEAEIRTWALANWDDWEAKQPAFFTNKWIDRVPSDCIPFKWAVKYRKTRGRRADEKRGSVSVKEMLGGEDEDDVLK
jgi:hypothetical protein